MANESPEVSKLMDSVIEITGQLYDMGVAHGRECEKESHAEMLREASNDVSEAKKLFTLKAKECTEWYNKAVRFESESMKFQKMVDHLCDLFPVAMGDELYKGIYDKRGRICGAKRYTVRKEQPS